MYIVVSYLLLFLDKFDSCHVSDSGVGHTALWDRQNDGQAEQVSHSGPEECVRLSRGSDSSGARLQHA